MHPAKNPESFAPDAFTASVEVPFAPAPIIASPPTLNLAAGVVVETPIDPLVVLTRSPLENVEVAIVDVAWNDGSRSVL